MRTIQLFRATALVAALLGLTAQASRAQTTAIWIGPASGGEWNTAANWSTGLAPADLTTNAFIGQGTNVNYNTPMVAGSFGQLLITNGSLTINTNGFVVGASGNTAVTLWGAGGTGGGGSTKLLVNSNGVLSITNGGLTLTNAASLVVNTGGVFTASGILSVGANSGNNPGRDGFFTNNSGTVKVGGLRISPSDGNANSRAVINGGTNDFGDVIIQRSNLGSFGAPGVEGLLIYGGLVRMTSLDVGGTGGDSFLTMLIADGTVTNTGAFTMRQKTAARASRFLQTGGLFVSTASGGVHFRGQPANNAIVIYSVTGGTNIVDGFVAADVGDVAGTLNFTNAAKIYVGASGFTNNTMSAINVALNAGGTFGASADWLATVPMTMGGSFIFNAAGLDGTAHNITLNGALGGSGSATLTKNGGGTLTLNGTNNYLGDTLVNAGTVAVGASGLLTGSGRVVLAPGTTLDVSAVTGGFTNVASKTLAGWGVVTGAVSMASAAIIDPGTNGATGTLSFSNSVTETGGAKNHFDLSTNPSGPNNDLVVIQGDFNVSGVSNIIEISGGGPSGSVHPLFKYSGTFNGDAVNFTNFTIVGPIGVLTNITTSTPKMIAFRAIATLRSPTNIVWVGNSVVNDWDVLTHSNWVNGAALDYFLVNDSVTFNAAGAANPNVNIPANVLPNSVKVSAATDYVFAGAGGIGGAASLTKTNAGKLTIQNTNQFTGGVTINQGTVSVASLADDGVDSPLGKTGTILVEGGTLEYTGPNDTWTRAFSLGTNGQDGVSIGTGITLTQTGTIGGSGSLTKTGNGTLLLNGNNGYSGGTFIAAGNLTINNVLGAGSGIINLTNPAANLNIGAVKPANTINVSGDGGTINGGNSGGSTGIRNVTGSSNLTVNVSGGSTFDLTGDMSTYGGIITLQNGGGAFVRFNGSIGSPLATWNLNGGLGAIDLNVRTGSTSNNLGALTGTVGATLSGRTGSGNNGGTTHYIGANGSSTTFSGIIQNGAGTTAITKVGGGTLTLTGGNTYSGNTTISGGTLALSGAGSIGSTPTIDVRSGAFLDVSGLATPTLVLGTQTLKGNGTVNGSIDTTGGGTVSPGASIGTLTVTNVATLSGTTYMELNRTNGGLTNDVLVAGSIVYGGTLTVTNLGPNLVAGDRFVLFSGPFSGSFATTDLPGNLGSVSYTWTNKLAIDGSIQVLTVTTVNTNPTNIVTSVSGSTLTLSWPADHTGWRLQSQTNALTTGLTATWTDIPGTDTSNTYNTTINPANGTVFYRLVYP